MRCFQLTTGERVRNGFKYTIVMIDVIRIEEADIISGRRLDALVHRVVEALVALGNQRRDAISVFIEYFQRAIAGFAIYDDVFDIRKCLIVYGLHRFRDGGARIQANGNDGKFHELRLKITMT